MVNADYPVFKQFMDEIEPHPIFLRKIKQTFDEQQKNLKLNVTELEFDCENNTVKIFNRLMSVNESDPTSFCQLSIHEFFTF